MPRRLTPTKLEHVVDGLKLRSQLTAAAHAALGDAAAQRKGALEVLRAALFRGRMIAKERLENGAGGIETAQLLAGVTDEVVTALYDFTTVHVFRARNPTEGERLAVLAVGGYGRGSLAPFSDLDLLFLRPYKPTAHGESVIEFMLYALWDLGFKVGHASRSVDECIRLSREDITIRTAILEGRRLTGDQGLSEELGRRFRAEVVAGTGAEFVAAKLKERDDRHRRADASRYLVEPNVKEGKGALRDLHTLFWIARYLHPGAQPAGKEAGEVVELQAFDRREVGAFARAFDFFWAVRCHLHFATGRAEERLTFDLQPEIARRMGYGDRVRFGEENPAVERFMRRYFLVAKEVGALTRAFSAKLEAEHVKQRPRGISRFLPTRNPRRGVGAAGFHQEHGRLNIDAPDVFENDPANLLRLFLLADRKDLDLHPDAFTAATRALSLIGPSLRQDQDAVRTFLDVLAHGQHTYRTLSLMNEAGVLGRFTPEFGKIVCQMQYNMYHAYTVDEHTLRAVGVIADIAAGRLGDDHPLAVQVFPKIADREALFLAMLLHDTGKGGEGGQEVAGGRAARIAGARMGLAPARVELIAWLIEHHLLMSDVAQKRDIADPRTVAAFAAEVADPERLRLLLVLTVADIRAVGPGVWNGWKGQLLRELYAATEAHFRGGLGGDATREQRERLHQQALTGRARLAAVDPAARSWAVGMEDAYFAAFGEADQRVHAGLIARAGAGRAAATARVAPDRNATEATVVAPDRQGLFADLAAALAGAGANVVGARAYTSDAGQALDVFYLQDVTGQPFGGDDVRTLPRLTAALEAAAAGQLVGQPTRKPIDLGRTAAFAISPIVTLDQDAADDATVVETTGRDRPGLLADLSRAVTAAGLSVHSAHIGGYGERAVNAFYVQHPDGTKLGDPAAAALKASLLDVLCLAETAPPKRRLQRARASAYR